MKKPITLATLQQLTHTIMDEFEWYFVKIYLFNRERMHRILTATSDRTIACNAEYIIVENFEKNAMQQMLPQLNKLVIGEHQQRQIIRPQHGIIISILMRFLELRITALVAASIAMKNCYKTQGFGTTSTKRAIISEAANVYDEHSKNNILRMALRTKELTIQLADTKIALKQQDYLIEGQVKLVCTPKRYLFSLPIERVKEIDLIEHFHLHLNEPQYELSRLTFKHNTLTKDPQIKNSNISISQCSGTLVLNNLHSTQTIRITNSPKLKLLIINSTISRLIITGYCQSVTLKNCLIGSLFVQASLRQLCIENNTDIRQASIQESTVEILRLSRSRVNLQILQSSSVNQLLVEKNVLLTLTCANSHFSKLDAQASIFASFSQCTIHEAKLSVHSLTGLFFHNCDTSATILQSEHSSAAHQTILKEGKLIAFIASNGITHTAQPLALAVEDMAESPVRVHRMSALLDPNNFGAQKNYSSAKPMRYQAAQYEWHCQHHARQAIGLAGLELLRLQVNPDNTLWQTISHLSSHYHPFSRCDWGDRLLQIAFERQMKAQLESHHTLIDSQHDHEAGLVVFSALVTDRIIHKSTYPYELKLQYRREIALLSIFLTVAEEIASYCPPETARKKQRLLLDILRHIENANQVSALTVEQAIHRWQRLLADICVIEETTLQQATFLNRLIHYGLSLLQTEQAIQQAAKPARLILLEQIERHLTYTWAKQLKHNTLVHLSKKSETAAIQSVLHKIASLSINNPAFIRFKQAIDNNPSLTRFRELSSTREKLMQSLQHCQLFLNAYRPIFSWFGPGQKKWICTRMLLDLISDNQKTLLNRLIILKKQLAYLTQSVDESSPASRHRVILQSRELWNQKSRPENGYCFVLSCLKKIIDNTTVAELSATRSCRKDRINRVLKPAVTRSLFQRSQLHFFQRRQLSCTRAGAQ